MTSARDRQQAVSLVNEARHDGARLSAACRELGIGMNTYRRWANGGVDDRPTARRPKPNNALSAAERTEVLRLCHRPEHASLPPLILCRV